MSPDPAVTEAPPGEADDAVDERDDTLAKAPVDPEGDDRHDGHLEERDEPAPPTLRRPANGAGDAPRLVTAEEAMSRRQRRRAARLRARKVKRIVRRLDAWSVLKVSFIFYLCVYVVSMVSAVILWNVASGAGVVDNIESFIEDLGAFETFEFVPDKLLQGTLLGGAVLTVLATGLTALGSVLFNLISDLVGGIRLTVIEEPGARPAMRARKAAKLAARVAPPMRPEPVRVAPPMRPEPVRVAPPMRPEPAGAEASSD